MMGCSFCAQRPRPRITYAGASAIARNPFTDQARRLYRAHHFARKNVNLPGRALFEIENAAIALRSVLDNADGEARADVLRVFRPRHGFAAISPHSFKPCETHWPEFRFVQDCSIRLRDRLVRIRSCPVICILRRATKGAPRAPIGIECSKGAVTTTSATCCSAGGNSMSIFSAT